MHFASGASREEGIINYIHGLFPYNSTSSWLTSIENNLCVCVAASLWINGLRGDLLAQKSKASLDKIRIAIIQRLRKQKRRGAEREYNNNRYIWRSVVVVGPYLALFLLSAYHRRRRRIYTARLIIYVSKSQRFGRCARATLPDPLLVYSPAGQTLKRERCSVRCITFMRVQYGEEILYIRYYIYALTLTTHTRFYASIYNIYSLREASLSLSPLEQSTSARKYRRRVCEK